MAVSEKCLSLVRVEYMKNNVSTVDGKPLPVGFIAQLIEHCSDNCRAWVRIPFDPEFFQSFVSHLLMFRT